MQTKENEITEENVNSVEPDDYEEQMFKAFIGKPEKEYYYSNAFSKYNINGIDKMSWVWSWWAFGGGIFFFLYRKLYVEAAVLFIITLLSRIVPFGGLIISILVGGFGIYFVYKRYKKLKIQIESTIKDPAKRIETMRQLGGVNIWAVWVAVLIYALIIIGVIMAFSANSSFMMQYQHFNQTQM